jgi:hypothetical protein
MTLTTQEIGTPRSISPKRLRAVLRDAWSAETSVDPSRWSPSNPAYGQCAVTAIVVQDHLGGAIWRCRINGVSHYFNVLDGDRRFDLTKEQFPLEAVESDLSLSSREYVLSFEATKGRYQMLSGRLDELIGPS